MMEECRRSPRPRVRGFSPVRRQRSAIRPRSSRSSTARRSASAVVPATSTPTRRTACTSPTCACCSRAHLRIGGLTIEPLAVQQDVAEHGDVRRPVRVDRHLGRQPARGPPPPRRQRVARADRGPQLQPGPVVDRRRARGGGRLRRRVRDQGGPRGRSRASIRCEVSGVRPGCSAGGWATSTDGPSWRRHGHHGADHRLRASGGRPTSSAGATWSVGLDLSVAVGKRVDLPASPSPSRHAGRTPAQPRTGWRRDRGCVRPTAGWPRPTTAAIEDLAALRLHDPAGEQAPGAGGRRTVVHGAVRSRRVDRRLHGAADRPRAGARRARGAGRAAGNRGRRPTEEQPGGSCTRRGILGAERINLTGHSAYYGSIDATPLFVMMLGELCRWGIDDDDLHRVAPARRSGARVDGASTAIATATASSST